MIMATLKVKKCCDYIQQPALSANPIIKYQHMTPKLLYFFKFSICSFIWNLRAHIEKSALNDLRFTRIIATALQSIVGVSRNVMGCFRMGFPQRFLRM